AESTLQVRGLNQSIQAAVGELSRRGVDDVMIVHGDLPLISTVEISQLLRVHRAQGSPALTLSPDDCREGSNCLLCTPASRLTYCYGSNSFARHAAQASYHGMSLQVVALPGIGCDIDTPQDLLALFERVDIQSASHTYRYITANDLVGRLSEVETSHFTTADVQYSWAS
ncbi:MAG: hypothetical protein V3T17_01520, partial [Pseudomonadales bacterium]